MTMRALRSKTSSIRGLVLFLAAAIGCFPCCIYSWSYNFADVNVSHHHEYHSHSVSEGLVETRPQQHPVSTTKPHDATLTNSSIPFLVFARYNEDLAHLDWVKDYPHIIYNRGAALPEDSDLPSTSSAASKHFHLEEEYSNVGREAFIYLHYIIQHYHMLPHLIVFSQTNQLDRSIFNFNDDDFHALIDRIARGETRLLPENDGFAYLVPKCYGFWYGIIKPEAHRDFPTYFKDLIQVPIERTRFQPTGCFIVQRDIILRQPKTYYVRLIKTLSTENDPVIGHFFEHAWSQILHSSCSTGEEYFCGLDNLKEKC